MCENWGNKVEEVKANIYMERRDKIFSFNSLKKRSTAVLHRSDGSVRIYVKVYYTVMNK
jgi:hypothetical protein